MPLDDLKSRIRACTLCADRFAATATAHRPRPVVWCGAKARILVAGQAPGLRVHETGTPCWDRSGDRLRDWMGIDQATFYDTDKLAVIPMAFCFPGYDARGADLPPPRICAETWRARLLSELPHVRLTLGTSPLPHPSWRNTAWLKRNPWFEQDLLPVLRNRVQEALA